LGGGVVDAYLKRRKTALQFNGAMLGTIDFEGETGFGQFDRSAGHSGSVVIGGSVCIWLR